MTEGVSTSSFVGTKNLSSGLLDWTCRPAGMSIVTVARTVRPFFTLSGAKVPATFTSADDCAATAPTNRNTTTVTRSKLLSINLIRLQFDLFRSIYRDAQQVVRMLQRYLCLEDTERKRRCLWIRE